MRGFAMSGSGSDDTFFVFQTGKLRTMNPQDLNMTRRSILKTVAAASAVGFVPGLHSTAWAAGSDKPELEEVKIGFIPLTD